jgi:hypothetical protein
MSIDELLNDPARRDQAAMPEMDALVDGDALQEGDLVDVRFDADGSSVAMLLDLRAALQFRVASTAVLVLRGVRGCSGCRARCVELVGSLTTS